MYYDMVYSAVPYKRYVWDPLEWMWYKWRDNFNHFMIIFNNSVGKIPLQK